MVQKVLFITSSDLSGESGHNLATKEMLTAFSQSKHFQTSLIAPAPENNLSKRITQNIFSYRKLSVGDDWSIFEHISTQVQLSKLVLRAIRKEQPDLIVCRVSHLMIIPPIYSTISSIPYVCLARGLSHRRGRFSTITTAVFGLNVRLADEVICAYDKIKQEADTYRNSKQPECAVFPNAVDPELFAPEDQEVAKSKISIGDDSVPTIGFVGSFKDRHQIDLLLRALSGFDKEARCLLVGNGPQYGEIKQLIAELGMSDNVLLPGFVSHEEVSTYISACDIMYGVADPEQVSNPIKCYEYLACERPVLTSKTPELQFIEEEGLGVAVTELTEQSVRDGVERLLSKSEDERRRMGERGRTYVIENHTWDQLPKRVLELISTD